MPVPRLRSPDELLRWSDQMVKILARQIAEVEELTKQSMQLRPPGFEPANLPPVKASGQLVTVNDGVLGTILLLSSGGVWRRVDNLAVYP
jgi:hypothetical protein